MTKQEQNPNNDENKRSANPINNNKTYDGKFKLTLGCMSSGKTELMIRLHKRYTIGGKKCIYIGYKQDNRFLYYR